ncbi:MAG: hypothetical protein ACKV2V_11340 [Blastocatellia bacterium]
MSSQQLTMVDGSPVLVFSQELMRELGINVGDDLDLFVENRTLLIRSRDLSDRRAMMDAAMENLMERRHEVYEQLAEGVK